MMAPNGSEDRYVAVPVTPGRPISDIADAVSPLVVAFIQGAKWWEWKQTGATMWQSDQNEALEEAEGRERRGTLGKGLVEVDLT